VILTFIYGGNNQELERVITCWRKRRKDREFRLVSEVNREL